MNINLQHKTAVVCGSTQGIGLATSLELAQLGAQIILIARDENKLKETQALLDTSNNQSHSYIQADFSQPELLKSKLQYHLKNVQQVHILVNNTGGPAGGQAIDAATDQFVQAFQQHLVCNQVLAQALVPLMKNAGYGRIINVISTSVKQPIPGLGVSNTIRAAVANWAKTLSLELGPFGITVNNVLPGATQTQRIESLIASRAAQNGKTTGEIRKMMEEEIPLKRFATAEETAAAIAFLASPAAAYISGINLPVDGGKTGCL